jgi:exopolysaccharide production protein ExoQ
VAQRHTITARLFGVRLVPRPRVVAVVLAILAFSPELKFRIRDAAASFSGDLDLQVMVELAIWGVVGVWAFIEASRGLTTGRYKPGDLGLPSRAMLILTVLIVLSASMSFSVRSLARAFQFTVLTVVVLILVWESRRDERFFPEVWRRLRKYFVGVVVGSMAINAAVPLWPPLIDVDGYPRYRWFAVHPVEVGGMTAVALVMVAGAVFGHREKRWPKHVTIGVLVLMGGLFAALVATRTRSALGAALVGAAVLMLMSRNRRERRVASLGVMAAIVALIAVLVTPTGAVLVDRVLTRGQTAAQLESLSQRTEILDIALNLFHDRPLLGWGYQEPGPILSTYYPWAGHGHNIFIEALMAFGIVGVVVILGLFVTSMGVFMSARGTRQRTPLDAIAPEVLAAFLVVLIMGLTSPSIAGNVGYEAGVILWFVAFSDAYRHHARAAVASRTRRMVRSLRS